MTDMTDVATPRSPRDPAWKNPFAIGAAALSLGLAAAAVGLTVYLAQPDLAERDPAGARACQILTSWQRGDLSDDRLTIALTLGDQAARSSTEAIRETSGEPVFDDEMMETLRQAGYAAGNMRFANLRDLHAACESQGVDMPPWVEVAPSSESARPRPIAVPGRGRVIIRVAAERHSPLSRGESLHHRDSLSVRGGNVNGEINLGSGC